MNSTFSFSRYGGTVAAGVWTLGWAVAATQAVEYYMSQGNALAVFNLIVAVAATLFGGRMAVLIFPRKSPRIVNSPDTSSPEPWHRRVVGGLALSVWCAVAIVWNPCVFHIAIQAATEGQVLTMALMIPFSLVGGFLLLMFFTAIGTFLDSLFHIKNSTEPQAVPGDAPARVPPTLRPTQTPAPSPPLAPAPVQSSNAVQASDDSSLFENTRILGTLALIAFINWFVFAGISIHLGGDAIETLPSQDGFILTSHGRHTPVSESTWVFSLYYSAATLLLTPAIFLSLFVIKFWPRRREGKWYKKLFVGAFITVWCIGWFGGIGHDFLKSRADWKNLKNHSTISRH